jgi:hypothetical protein
MRSERGISFLEVVFSAALLAIVAATVSTGFSVVEGLSRNGERQLAAYEIAHRLILQNLDNPGHMPSPDLPLPAEVTGRIEKFWYLRNISKLTPEGDSAAGSTVRGQVNANLLSTEERITAGITQVTIEVYEDFDGRRAATPLASLTRIYNPFAGSEDDPASFLDNLTFELADNPDIQALLRQLFQQQMQDIQRQQQQSAPPALQQPAEAPPK